VAQAQSKNRFSDIIIIIQSKLRFSLADMIYAVDSLLFRRYLLPPTAASTASKVPPAALIEIDAITASEAPPALIEIDD